MRPHGSSLPARPSAASAFSREDGCGKEGGGSAESSFLSRRSSTFRRAQVTQQEHAHALTPSPSAQ
jgi:hypothetical protein